MKSNNQGEKPFISLRTKILVVFSLLLVGIILITTIALPKLLRQYFINSKFNEVKKTKEVVTEILSKMSFPGSREAQYMLNTAAKSSEVSIWICQKTGDDSTLTIYAYGTTTNSVDDFVEFNKAKLSTDEANIILDIMDGKKEGLFNDSFSSAFEGSTYSMGFRYQSHNDNPFGPGTEKKSNYLTVLIHVAMDDIVDASRQMMAIIFAIVGTCCVACWLVVFSLTQNVILPVKKLQMAADSITKGDFSNTLDVVSNDEIGQLTKSFNTMTKELKEVDSLQRDFIANISHDFRSPLTSIKGFLEAMMDGTIPSESYPRYMGIVLDETNRLTKLANNVLDLTKMENGQIELKPTCFDINEEIVKLALGFEQRIDENNITIDFQFIQTKLLVFADLGLIERVIYNLIDNALKFTDKGGTIIVETSIVGKKAQISVKDSGIGISEESLPYIFERFHKGDRSRGKDKKGTGLGLTIAKQIMLAHHEDITVFSTLGKGTTFCFTLPLSSKNK